MTPEPTPEREQPQKFRKKPVVIEAIQWLPNDVQASERMIKWLRNADIDWYVGEDTSRLVLPTLEGSMEARPSDWVIRGVQGEFYPCKPDIFEQTYEPA